MLSPTTSSRIAALDSLRGLAALSVVLLHAFSAYLKTDQLAQHGIVWQLIVRSPLVLPISGHEAVILFFMLSGFVLALPYLSNRPPSYRSFVIRRVCRIYLPYIAALAIGLLARSSVSVRHLPGMTDWVADYWAVKQSLATVVGYIFMTGLSHHVNINPVVWSLVHEMRISMIFPGLFWLTKKSHSSVRLTLLLAFSVVCSMGVWDLREPNHILTTAQMIVRSLLETGSYVWYFIVGIELAMRREVLAAFLGRRPGLACLVLALSLVCYCVRYEVPALMEGAVGDFLVGVGAAGFICLVLAIPVVQRILTTAPILLIGRCSYSLYLIHLIVMLTMLYGLSAIIPAWIILTAFPFVAVGIAVVMWRFVEIPSQEWGRRLARRSEPLPLGELSPANSSRFE